MIDPNLRETTIPFCGFYCSLADGQIDAAVELMQYNADEDPESELHGIPDLWDKINYREVFLAYAQEYLERYQEWLADEWELDIGLRYGELSSPREYNFTTDQIIAQMTDEDLLTLRRFVLKNLEPEFRRLVHDRLKERSGFMPFYSNDLDDWPVDPRAWETAQRGMLFAVFGELPVDWMDEIDVYQMVDEWLELPGVQDG